jgi:3-dehydroquinate synthetase
MAAVFSAAAEAPIAAGSAVLQQHRLRTQARAPRHRSEASPKAVGLRAQDVHEKVRDAVERLRGHGELSVPVTDESLENAADLTASFAAGLFPRGLGRFGADGNRNAPRCVERLPRHDGELIASRLPAFDGRRRRRRNRIGEKASVNGGLARRTLAHAANSVPRRKSDPRRCDPGVTETAKAWARAAREAGDGRFVTFCDAGALPLARRIAREAGASGATVVDVRGTTMAIVDKLHAALRRRAASRNTVVVACGAGALLDAVRLAAALYDGGAKTLLVATTLGAAIDRGVDPVARRGASAVVAPPLGLYVDYGTIPRFAKDGLGTLVRDALIEGDEFFDGLETLSPHPLRKWPWESVIDDALRVDRMHAGDERQILDLGLPFARAIAATRTVVPQTALALGIRAACLTARRVAKFGERDHLRVLAVLALLGFALHDEGIDADAVLERIPPETRFALPHAIGDVEAGLAIPRATLRRSIARLTTTPGAAEFR